MRTDGDTSPTLDAPPGVVEELYRSGLGLWVTAPPTAEAAPFQKENRADAGAIVQAEALNIEYHSSHRLSHDYDVPSSV